MAQTVRYQIDQEEESRRGWYLRSRDEFVAGWMRRKLKAGRDWHVLDAGCGTGGVIEQLARDGVRCTGTDMDLGSLRWGAEQKRVTEGAMADICRLPFRDGAFDFAVSSEVLEHVRDDEQGMRELLRVTRKGVLISVPAHMYLWTDSDDILLHHRRYSRESLEEMIRRAGGKVSVMGSFGCLPGAMVLAYKGLQRLQGGTKKKSEAELPLASRFPIPPFVDRLLGGVFRAELWLDGRRWIRWGHSWWVYVEHA